jgi:hypothetical protein
MNMIVTVSLTRPQVLALYTRLTFELDWGDIDATEEGAMQAVVDALRAASPDENLDQVIERVGPNTPLPPSGAVNDDVAATPRVGHTSGWQLLPPTVEGVVTTHPEYDCEECAISHTAWSSHPGGVAAQPLIYVPTNSREWSARDDDGHFRQ